MLAGESFNNCRESTMGTQAFSSSGAGSGSVTFSLMKGVRRSHLERHVLVSKVQEVAMNHADSC